MILKLNEIWRKRYSFSPNIENWRPYQGWSKDEKKHLVFLKIIDERHVVRKIEDLQEELSSFHSYIKFPKDYYHITLKPNGFLDDKKTNPDNFSKEDIRKIIVNVNQIISNVKKFEITLKSINMFKDVIFIEVQDNNKFSLINKKLLKVPNIKPLKRDYPNFLPHCSIGTFRTRNIKSLTRKLETFRNLEFGKILVDNFQLVIAHWHKIRYPKFEVIKTFKLR